MAEKCENSSSKWRVISVQGWRIFVHITTKEDVPKGVVKGCNHSRKLLVKEGLHIITWIHEKKASHHHMDS